MAGWSGACQGPSGLGKHFTSCVRTTHILVPTADEQVRGGVRLTHGTKPCGQQGALSRRSEAGEVGQVLFVWDVCLCVWRITLKEKTSKHL